MATGGMGKRKGSAHERKICEALSLWITHGQKKDCLWRAAMSGGRATIIHKRGGQNRQAGDIVAVAPEGHVLTDYYLFECKHYKNIKLDSFIISASGPIAKWWKEACKQAKQHKREPVLLMKQNHLPILVLTYPLSQFNKRPLANLEDCDLGLLDRVLKEKFIPPRKIMKRTILQFPGDKDLELK
jgi:hypothetical protein